jgi:hypothetical protein
MSTAFDDAGYSGAKVFCRVARISIRVVLYVGEQSRAGRLGTLVGNPE